MVIQSPVNDILRQEAGDGEKESKDQQLNSACLQPRFGLLEELIQVRHCGCTQREALPLAAHGYLRCLNGR